ncbi:lipoyl synthase [Virgibacillus halodenitrificans]|uniref:Lipoyl synthase n=1 Tax=Virgibacillus halodenitrificans TaxID=1482 RepID=A0AAC9NIJ1_VIRHA|nr:lipoyl synthase [Virgibacillus halodenitrificans]APC46987.1 lipoyl synthase [Virgibacillus halodenitrificans]MBD1223031.1 lipoyl synthase [Virgibacillus halodenitrificans]MCG1027415.1 lipoyl synthase [Virgibacillus halodenitrificans]MCJ0930290.1 lipoyl synthase [Virgibacillus halodenitrificans]MEC2159480.1 lipoyl synthase [Virgibacillus halodenitrificans]
MAKQQEYIRKPEWLKTKINTNKSYTGLKKLMRDKKLNTVCEEARCPNIHECWSERKTATFMILGDTCTRGCRFCAVKTGLPNELDWGEPERVAESVEIMGLKHVVVTAVARDDLNDGGAAVFAETVRAIRKLNPGCTVEILPSDMKGDYESLSTLMNSKPDIFNHNIETVRRLTKRVRARAMYDRSLQLLQRVKLIAPTTPTKSSIMVGLGETKEEIIQAMDDLLAHGVDIMTIGQYLQPTKKHLLVERYYHPDEFQELKEIALEKGFRHCESGPMVRSSYHADEQVSQASAQRRINYMQGYEKQEDKEVDFKL